MADLDAKKTEIVDVVSKEQPSQKEQKPSTEAKEVFTKDEVDQLIRQRHSALDKQIAGLQKDLDATRKQAENSTAKVSELLTQAKAEEDRQYQTRLEAAQGDPDLMDALKQEQRTRKTEEDLQKKERELEQRYAEYGEKFELANEIMKREEARKVAGEFSIDVETLLKFRADTPEEMREYAETISKHLGKVEPEVKPSLKPDSGVGTGVGLDLDKLSPIEKIKLGLQK